MGMEIGEKIKIFFKNHKTDYKSQKTTINFFGLGSML
jgi:hypothetical protein